MRRDFLLYVFVLGNQQEVRSANVLKCYGTLNFLLGNRRFGVVYKLMCSVPFRPLLCYTPVVGCMLKHGGDGGDFDDGEELKPARRDAVVSKSAESN